MKIKLGNDRWNLWIYNWHSINIVPQFSVCQSCNDNPPYKITGILIWLTLFGVVFCFGLPVNPFKRYKSFPKNMWWCYSRDRKRWYKPSEEV